MNAAIKFTADEIRTARNQRIADSLGDKRAQIKRLQDEAKALENELLDEMLSTGSNVFEGWRFRVTITRGFRKLTNWQKIARDLGASARKIAGNTKESSVTRVVVSAHKKQG